MTSLDHFIGVGASHDTFSVQAMLVVAAAREWAAAIWEGNEQLPVEFSGELPTVTIGSEEEERRLALLDAVHDLEHHNGTFPRSIPPAFLDSPL